MRLDLDAVAIRWGVILIETAALLALVGWTIKTCVASFVSDSATVPHLQFALRLDPGNADYYLRIGRLHLFGLTEIQPDEAIHEFREAIRLNPYDPEAWSNLANALELQGKTAEAEQCLERVDLLAPNLPLYQWPIANFYLLQGNVDQAFQHFKKVLAGSSEHNQIVFSRAWMASDDPDKILNQVIPHQIDTELSYLYYLTSQKHFSDAHAVWQRLISSNEKVSPQQSARYIDELLGAQKVTEAYQSWTDLQKEGVVKEGAAGADQNQNLITNGDFEDEMSNMGFAWRLATVDGVYAGLDDTTYHSPSHALLVEFQGKRNVDYHQAYQYVVVSPNSHYQLRAFLMTEEITTDSGPRLEVRDAYNPADLDQYSADLVGSSGSWTSLTLDFSTGPKTGLIIVSLARLPSHKFDNQIAGKVWVDDVRLSTSKNPAP